VLVNQPVVGGEAQGFAAGGFGLWRLAERVKQAHQVRVGDRVARLKLDRPV
jgi:hypothetical protein